jgi:endonuclease VIII
MPEGHTLHRLALDLTDVFGGRTVSVTSPQGRFAASAAFLDQTRMLEATAHGKHLFCEFDGERFLHVHLGLIGKFQLGPPEPPWGEVRVRIATPDVAADLRGPQLCAVATRSEIDAAMAELGPDPLRADADPELAWRRIRRASRPIAALLMDQTILSGVGNVYRAEVLFRAGIDPHRPGAHVDRATWDALWQDLVTLMRAGVRLGRIVTTRPEYRSRRTGPVDREDAHYVYRRTGLPCRLCGTPVLAEPFVARTLYRCPVCQAA